MKNTLVLSIGTFLPKFSSIILLPLLTGYLTKEEYGTYDLITVLVSLVLPTLTLQIQQAAFRFLIDARGDERGIKAIVTDIIAFVVPIATLGSAVMFFVLPTGNWLTTLFVVLYYWTDVVENAFLQCARGLGRNLDYSISALICSVGQLVFAAIFVVFFELGLLGAAIMLFAADLVELIYILVRVKMLSSFDISLIDLKVLKGMLSYSWPLVPNSMSMWVMRLSNRLVITFFMGPAANASFAVAYKIPQILSLIQNTFTMAWQENATIATSDADADEYYSKMFRTIYDLMAGLLAVLIALAPLLFSLLIRGNYDDAFPHVAIMFIGVFFLSISAFLGGIYVAKMRTASIGITTVAAALINLIIDVVGVPRFGLFGASIAIVVSYLFLCVYRMIEVRKFANIDYGLPRCFAIIIILISMAALCFTQYKWAFIVNLVIGSLVFIVLAGKTVAAILSGLYRRVARK